MFKLIARLFGQREATEVDLEVVERFRQLRARNENLAARDTGKKRDLIEHVRPYKLVPASKDATGSGQNRSSDQNAKPPQQECIRPPQSTPPAESSDGSYRELGSQRGF